jgi:predicted DNA-binding helix-hairpin-helix protein
MMDETLTRKLRVLADAAKYDASCASRRRDVPRPQQMSLF